MIMRNFNAILVVLILLLSIFASGLGMIFYWTTWPYNPLEIHSIKILNLNNTVQQGGTLAYHIKWTKYTDKQCVVRRYFVNGQKHHLDGAFNVIGSAPIGPGEADIFMPVPIDTPPSIGRLQFTAAYQMNPLRVVVAPITPAYSDRFTVTERPTPKGEKGDTGDTGKTGKIGETDPRGERGLRGEKGG